MADAGSDAAVALAGIARDIAAQAVTQAQGQLDTLMASAQSAAGAAQDAVQRAVALPADVLQRITELADQQDPLGTVMWLMVKLANSLAPAGVTLTAYDPAPGTGRPRSLAVTYTSGIITVALAFSTVSPAGGGLVLSAHGNAGGPVDIVAGAVHVHIEGLSEDSISIPFAAGVAVDSHSTVTAMVELTSAPGGRAGPAEVQLGRPALSVALTPSVDAFHYRAELALRGNGLRIDLASVLGDLAEAISLPSIDDLDVTLTLEDGNLRLGQLTGAGA